jgi:hypothetical protein
MWPKAIYRAAKVFIRASYDVRGCYERLQGRRIVVINLCVKSLKFRNSSVSVSFLAPIVDI